MKKTILGMAVAFCGSALMASGSIESANVVGYTTIDAPAAGRYVALGVKFENASGGDYTINNVLVNSAPKGAPAFNTAADCIWLWDPTLSDGAGNWAKYFYSSIRKGFVKQGESTLATTALKNGDTLLFYRGTGAAAATLTLSGAVAPLAGQVQQTGLAAGKYRFMCYPWPTSFNLKNLHTCQSSPKGAPAFNTAADCVWIWDVTLSDGAGNWAKYYYSSIRKGYVKQGASVLADVEIPAGEGFLFYRGTGGVEETITFSGPNYTAE